MTAMQMISHLRLSRGELTHRRKRKHRNEAVVLGGFLLFAICVVTLAALSAPADPPPESVTQADTAEWADAAHTRPSPSADATVVTVEDAAPSEEPVIRIPFLIESDSLVPVHPEASEASEIVGSVSPGAVLLGYRYGDAWIGIADTNGRPYFIKSVYGIPLDKETSDIFLFQEDHEVASAGFTIHTNINSISGMTLEDISFLLREYPALQEIGESVLLNEKKYGVNAYFILGVASQESGFGTSLMARKKNNLFGIGAYDEGSYENALSFNSKSECVEYFCSLILLYLESGRSTPATIHKRYASDELWASRVVQLMNSYATLVRRRHET